MLDSEIQLQKLGKVRPWSESQGWQDSELTHGPVSAQTGPRPFGNSDNGDDHEINPTYLQLRMDWAGLNSSRIESYSGWDYLQTWYQEGLM